MKRLLLSLVILGLLATPASAGEAHFFVNVTVTTNHPAHVRIRYVVKCESGQAEFIQRGRFRAMTPFETSLPTPIDQADSCHAAVWAFNLDHHRGVPVVDVDVVT